MIVSFLFLVSFYLHKVFLVFTCPCIFEWGSALNGNIVFRVRNILLNVLALGLVGTIVAQQSIPLMNAFTQFCMHSKHVVKSIFMLYLVGLSILQNGNLPQFLPDKINHDIFMAENKSPCVKYLIQGFEKNWHISGRF